MGQLVHRTVYKWSCPKGDEMIQINLVYWLYMCCFVLGIKNTEIWYTSVLMSILFLTPSIQDWRHIVIGLCVRATNNTLTITTLGESFDISHVYALWGDIFKHNKIYYLGHLTISLKINPKWVPSMDTPIAWTRTSQVSALTSNTA